MTDPEVSVRLAELEARARQLDPDAARRRNDGCRSLEHANNFLERLATAPAYERSQDHGAGLLAHPIVDQGIGLDQALTLLEQFVDREGIATASGRFAGYIPGGGLYHAALGDFLAAVTNRYAGVFFASPGAVRMENQLVRWTAELAGFPEQSAGYLASGGSVANLTAIVTARDAHAIEGEAIKRAVVYETAQTHHCIDKALKIAGLDRVQRRRVPVDDQYRMNASLLAKAIRDDRRTGLKPWMIIASAGTTNTGAVDPIDDIASIANNEKLWLHIDAAYGGYFALTEAGRQAMAGIERADSLVMDPHKTLFMPYGCGVLLVRDGQLLRRSHAAGADYMQDIENPVDEWSPADVSPELTRNFRGLRMWLPLKVLGLAPFRAALEEKLLLARYFYTRMAESSSFDLGPKPQLSIVTFRHRGGDQANRALIRAIQGDGRIFLSSTRLDGKQTLRLAVVCHRTHRADIDTIIDVLHELAKAV